MLKNLFYEEQQRDTKHTIRSIDMDQSVVECVRGISSFICSIIMCLVVVLIAILLFRHGGSLFYEVDRLLNVIYDTILEMSEHLWGFCECIVKVLA